ncbi:hypothetical protein BCR33DRAFT_788163 [Rhizoclosmatium globosum]|uniref:Uncharacterized protein n=1 Tax=Rhizoclosmatium globosum TaxID=329046 RepID=A0A1Y2BZN4_9FUNG|nr:hypothetical protein BCR33DRAFT_788163 [Rhizoclosmatium globosum]|eukprot:ORY39525.1 hypothetical protein BCR33DRAFT_788163 [Rhizoclosmatium globosum]
MVIEEKLKNAVIQATGSQEAAVAVKVDQALQVHQDAADMEDPISGTETITGTAKTMVSLDIMHITYTTDLTDPMLLMVTVILTDKQGPSDANSRGARAKGIHGTRGNYGNHPYRQPHNVNIPITLSNPFHLHLKIATLAIYLTGTFNASRILIPPGSTFIDWRLMQSDSKSHPAIIPLNNHYQPPQQQQQQYGPQQPTALIADGTASDTEMETQEEQQPSKDFIIFFSPHMKKRGQPQRGVHQKVQCRRTPSIR